MAERFNQKPNLLTDEISLSEGAKYYLGGLSAIAGGIGLAGEIAGSSDHAEVAFGIALALGVGSALTTETFGLKNLLKSYAEECTTLILALGTPIISTIIAANDAKIGLISLAAGEIAAAGSFIASRRQPSPEYPVKE
jgi:predicted regulator of Ras-like GTPase activity (Roadblock/LC7/MglB family)